MDLTVLELNLPQAEIDTPFSRRSRSGTERSDVRDDTPDESDDGGVSGLAAIAVLVGLAALAWYMRSRMGNGGRRADDVMAEGPA